MSINRRRYFAVGWLICILIAGISWRVLAQQSGGTQTAQQASHYDNCTSIANSGASGVTLTIAAPPSGQSIYVAEVDMGFWTTAAPTAGVATVTAAGFPNTNPIWTFEFPATANINVIPPAISYGPGGNKASPNTSVTYTGSTVTSISEYIHACYWYAP